MLANRSSTVIPVLPSAHTVHVQYAAEDPGGHRWTSSEATEDVDPASWGGTEIDLA